MESNVSQTRSWNNWWQNHVCTPENYYEPKDLTELVQLVQHASSNDKKLKVVGNGHSWSDIPCTDGYMVSLKHFNRVLELNVEQKTIVVEAGISIRTIVDMLSRHGLAFPSLGSVCDQTIAGALATGTHGSSLHHGGLAELVLEFEMVDGTGHVLRCSRQENSQLFLAGLVGLGAVGIVTQVKMCCTKQFWLLEKLECCSIQDVLKNMEKLSQLEYFRFWYITTKQDVIVNSFSKTTAPSRPEWIQPFLRILQNVLWYVWIYRYYSFVKRRLRLFTRIDKSQYILCYSRLLLKFYKLSIALTIPYKKDMMSEYGIPAEATATAMQQILEKVARGEIKGHLRFEVRFGDAESAWLSTAYQRRTGYIQTIFENKYFNSRQDQLEAFHQVENIMKNLDARPHWAKDHCYTNTDLRETYPRWNDFLEFKRKLDPFECFENQYLSRILNPTEVDE